MSNIVISTPGRDAKMHNPAEHANVPRTSKQLKIQAKQYARIMIDEAKAKQEKYGLSILTGRINLWPMRSDEIEEYIGYVKAFVRATLKREGHYRAVTFTLYERQTETAVLDDIRDLTFNATVV